MDNFLNEEGVEIEVFTLEMEDGKEQEFVVLDEFEFEAKDYIVVATIDAEDNIGEEEYIYGCVKEGDDIIVEYIDDEDEYNKIADAYEKLLEELDEIEEE